MIGPHARFCVSVVISLFPELLAKHVESSLQHRGNISSSCSARRTCYRVDELAELAKDRDSAIQKEACQVLAQSAARNPGVGTHSSPFGEWRRYGECVGTNTYPARRPIAAIFGSDSGFLDSSHGPIREQVVRSLDSGWLSVDIARQLAQERLADLAPEVRSRAAQVLRRISRG